MNQDIRTGFCDVRTADPAFVAKWKEERRLCGIIESEESSTEEKYEALLELARLSGVLASAA